MLIPLQIGSIIVAPWAYYSLIRFSASWYSLQSLLKCFVPVKSFVEFFQTLAIFYTSEVCPLILRFYLTNYISVCWLIDQLFGSAIMKNLQDNLAHSDVGRRFTYRLICIWLVPIASPFYVHQNFLNGSLNNIKSPRQLIVLEDFLIKDENREDLVVETMKRMKSISDKEEAGKDIGSYRKCFSKKPIIRTWIASMIWIE